MNKYVGLSMFIQSLFKSVPSTQDRQEIIKQVNNGVCLTCGRDKDKHWSDCVCKYKN